MSMTMKEAVNHAMKNYEFNDNSGGLNELVAYAYELGRHEGVVSMSRKINETFEEQIERANQTRYRHLCKWVQGYNTYIYDPYYSSDFVECFSNDIVKIEDIEVKFINQ